MEIPMFGLLLICIGLGLHVRADERTYEHKTPNDELVVNGYIPKTIPPHISRVIVLEFDAIKSGDDTSRYVNSSVFWDNSWKGVRYLALQRTTLLKTRSVILSNKCFSYLENLEKLYISVRDLTLLDEPFYGLPALSLLDFSGCQKMSQWELKRSLASVHSVPNLNYLDISNTWNNNLGDSVTLDSSFLKILFSKPIKGINLSFNNIANIDGHVISKSCGKLEYLNVSGCSFRKSNDSMMPWCDSIDVADISYTLSSPVLKINYRFRVDKNITIDQDDTYSIQYTHINDLRADGILNGVEITGGAILTYHSKYVWQLSSLSLRNNKLKRLDVKLNLPEFNIKRLDISMNELELINPLFLYHSWKILDYFELSDNNLYQMMNEDEISFSQIASSYPNLRYIGLAANNLTNIPESMFKYNQFLEVIDLSRNKLTTFNVILHKNSHLRELYLHNNNIATLDDYAKQNLNSLHPNVSVTFGSNPISCSACEDHALIDWILSSPVIVKEGPRSVTCLNSNSDTEIINQGTADRLQNVCKENTDRRNKLIFTSVFASIFTMVTVFIACYVRHHLRAKKHKKTMEDTIAIIQNDTTQYAVFLSFCSDDEEFVNEHVFDQLGNILQEVFNVDRVLVSTGDRNFKIGHWIAEETVDALKHASVVIIVVSDAYCQSRHCRMEFEQAYDLHKPIMLMYKGHVQGDLMFPVMRELYNRYTRILWEYVDGEYKLKTTWMNIGTSILNLLKDS